MSFRSWYENSQDRKSAEEGLQTWYGKIESENSESFNAKLKGFRGLVRGVRDVNFFLFRVGKLYG